MIILIVVVTWPQGGTAGITSVVFKDRHICEKQAEIINRDQPSDMLNHRAYCTGGVR